MKLQVIKGTKAESLSIAYDRFIKNVEVIDIKLNIEKENNVSLYVMLIIYKDNK